MMRDRSIRRDTSAEVTGQIDMSAVFAKLDQIDRKASVKPKRARRPLSWQAAFTIILVALGLFATVVLLAVYHVIPALQMRRYNYGGSEYVPPVLGPDELRGQYSWRFDPDAQIHGLDGSDVDQDAAPAFSWLGVAPKVA